MYDRYVNVASLVDQSLFEFFYVEASTETARIENFNAELDPDALELAGSKFVADYLATDRDMLAAMSWDRHVSIAINILVRATATMPIIRYKGPRMIESVDAEGRPCFIPVFNSHLIREKTNALVSFAFATSILSMEMSNYSRSQGWFSANLDALNELRTQHKARYVTIIDDDARDNFVPGAEFRRDFRVTWAIKALLRKHMRLGEPRPSNG